MVIFVTIKIHKYTKRGTLTQLITAIFLNYSKERYQRRSSFPLLTLHYLSRLFFYCNVFLPMQLNIPHKNTHFLKSCTYTKFSVSPLYSTFPIGDKSMYIHWYLSITFKRGSLALNKKNSKIPLSLWIIIIDDQQRVTVFLFSLQHLNYFIFYILALVYHTDMFLPVFQFMHCLL